MDKEVVLGARFVTIWRACSLLTPSPPLSRCHQGPYFAPPYERLPRGVQLVYDGKVVELSEKAEEAAGFFAKMLDHDYTKKDIFCDNFFADWRKVCGRSCDDHVTHYT